MTSGTPQPRRFEGKVAFITGVARGQGRNHAIAFAREGGSIIGIDVNEHLDSIEYPLANVADLEETAAAVRGVGGEIEVAVADVRDRDAIERALQSGVARFGRLDLVCANAGICSVQAWDAVTTDVWNDTIAVNLTGVWNTFAASIPHLITTGGGTMVVTSSTAGIKGLPFFTPYVASKHAVIGLMKSLANELAHNKIRVNAVLPTGVATMMTSGFAAFPGLLEANPHQRALFDNALAVPVVELDDVTEAILYLASEAGRYITGLELTVNAGSTIR